MKMIVQMQNSWKSQKKFQVKLQAGGQLWDLMMERIFAGLAKSSIFIVCRDFPILFMSCIEFSNFPLVQNFCFPNEDSGVLALFGNAHFWSHEKNKIPRKIEITNENFPNAAEFQHLRNLWKIRLFLLEIFTLLTLESLLHGTFFKRKMFLTSKYS